MGADLRRKVLGRLRPRPRAAPPAEPAEPSLVSAEDQAIIDRARPFTMTSEARLQAVIDAVRHCQRRGLPGAYAECGVWRGGSVMAMILTLQELGAERDIYLYDTFQGMTEPTEHDVSPVDRPALEDWKEAQAAGKRPYEDVFGAEAFDEQSVRRTLLDTGYPSERLHLVAGPVEQTIPGTSPGPMALLRLDTDWYESTRHELTHLYPLLTTGGVLIIDDYGHWEGARKAVDEYFASHAEPLLLNRIDYTGRVAVKA
ncbi:MAG TPA: TylF/MycF/NovP-related O-methyltransferase [Thermoleophilaceae bacterium]|nr:TylF/MycF/NovP-related O-methyltransferase [Thermoleophilaceae bacterium]